MDHTEGSPISGRNRKSRASDGVERQEIVNGAQKLPDSGTCPSGNARQALGIALTGMIRDGMVTRERALELARMVLRENARKLYGL